VIVTSRLQGRKPEEEAVNIQGLNTSGSTRHLGQAAVFLRLVAGAVGGSGIAQADPGCHGCSYGTNQDGGITTPTDHRTSPGHSDSDSDRDRGEQQRQAAAVESPTAAAEHSYDEVGINVAQPGTTIKGTDGNDVISVRDNEYNREVFINDRTVFVPRGPDEGLAIDGGEGDDIILGTAFDDNIHGGSGDDIIYGFDGRDELSGDGGVDTIFGNSGDDTIYGGTGDNRLYGNDGNDRLYGDSGSDDLYGGGGHDLLLGMEGKDRLFGGDGQDRLHGGMVAAREMMPSLVAQAPTRLSIPYLTPTGSSLIRLTPLNGDSETRCNVWKLISTLLNAFRL